MDNHKCKSCSGDDEVVPIRFRSVGLIEEPVCRHCRDMFEKSIRVHRSFDMYAYQASRLLSQTS